MLRFLFNEPRRVDEGRFKDVRQAISAYLSMVNQLEREQRITGPEAHRIVIWSQGFIAGLDELEQSIYAAKQYASLVKSNYFEEMNQQERDDYHRHFYFYKNAFIRLFSLLDKMGVFLDSRLKLGTKEIKDRFSYYTVLRRMYNLGVHPDLQLQLYEDKQAYQEPMDRLRILRNMEVHAMNAELVDDMQQAEYAALCCIRIENLNQHGDDLDQGYEMACSILIKVFSYFVQRTIA